MGLIDDAIALERRAEKNYRQAAEETLDVGAAKILGLLADEEAHHVEALAAGKREPIAGPDLLEAARTWVRGAIEGGATRLSPDAGLLDVLRRALDIEQMTEAFYREQGTHVGDERAKALFARLAEIEKLHFLFVSSLVEYYDRPNVWVEDAEFGLRPEY